MATIDFTKQGDFYVAEATVNNDYNLHVERDKDGSCMKPTGCIGRRTAGRCGNICRESMKNITKHNSLKGFAERMVNLTKKETHNIMKILEKEFGIRPKSYKQIKV